MFLVLTVFVVSDIAENYEPQINADGLLRCRTGFATPPAMFLVLTVFVVSDITRCRTGFATPSAMFDMQSETSNSI